MEFCGWRNLLAPFSLSKYCSPKIEAADFPVHTFTRCQNLEDYRIDCFQTIEEYITKLSLRNRILRGKLVVAQVVKKFDGTQRFIAVFTVPCPELVKSNRFWSAGLER